MNPFKKKKVKDPKDIEVKAEEVKASKNATGRTTRVIDKLVQDMFKNRKVTVKDHADGGSNTELMKRFLSRLKLEHGIDRGALFIEGNKVKFNK